MLSIFSATTTSQCDKFSTFYIYYMYGYLLSHQIFSASLFTRNIYIACLFFAWTLLTLSSQSTFMNENVSYLIYVLGIRGLVGSLFLTGFCYKIDELLSSTSIIKFVRFCGDRSLLIYVFHAPTIFLLTKIFHISASGSIAELICIVLASTLLPLAYGKVLSYFAPIHKLLLGQNP